MTVARQRISKGVAFAWVRSKFSRFVQIIGVLSVAACPVADAQEGSFRDPAAQPFSASSFWNTPLGSQAEFQSKSGAETAMLLNQNAGGPAGAFPWIGANAFSIFRQKPTDKIVRWYYAARSATAPWPHAGPLNNGFVDLRTPSDVKFLGGSDGHAVIITEDGSSAYEVWQGSYDPLGQSIHVNYMVFTDLYGLGMASREGTSEGIRAFGGSLLGGLIRCPELDHLAINHAVAMVISPTQLKAGRQASDQKVWPAMNTDNGGNNHYSGVIPMGGLFGIPGNVNLASLGLTPEGLALARAYQQFGGYVVDSAEKTNMIAVTETGCKPTHIADLDRDKFKILSALRMVSNSSSQFVGGPGQRVTPPPPPLKPR